MTFSKMFSQADLVSAVVAERVRCAEIFRDAAEKIACHHASHGQIPISEITPRSNRARDEFLKEAEKAAEKANSEIS